jgi:hypothetical protein
MYSGKKKKKQLQDKRAKNKPKVYEESNTSTRIHPDYYPIKRIEIKSLVGDLSRVQIRNNFPISHTYHTIDYPIPTRPFWSAKDSKSTLESREEDYFKEYLGNLKQHGKEDICFETDLEVRIVNNNFRYGDSCGEL